MSVGGVMGTQEPCSCSVKTTAAAATIRAEIAELARKADLIQVLLSNSVPVSMQSLESTQKVNLPLAA